MTRKKTENVEQVEQSSSIELKTNDKITASVKEALKDKLTPLPKSDKQVVKLHIFSESFIPNAVKAAFKNSNKVDILKVDTFETESANKKLGLVIEYKQV